MMMRRLALFTLCCCVGSLVVGCPGNLENPGDFGDATCTKTVDEIFTTTCGRSDCHDSVEPASGLDLVSPGFENDVIGMPSVAPGCTDRTLVVPGDPDASYLLDKTIPAAGICGLPMPAGAAIDARDVDCIRQWIVDLNSPPEMDAGSPDGGEGGTGGGTGSSGGSTT